MYHIYLIKFVAIKPVFLVQLTTFWENELVFFLLDKFFYWKFQAYVFDQLVSKLHNQYTWCSIEKLYTSLIYLNISLRKWITWKKWLGEKSL